MKKNVCIRYFNTHVHDIVCIHNFTLCRYLFTIVKLLEVSRRGEFYRYPQLIISWTTGVIKAEKTHVFLSFYFKHLLLRNCMSNESHITHEKRWVVRKLYECRYTL